MIRALIHTCRKAFETSRRARVRSQSCLTFLLSGIRFGIPFADVREIVSCGRIAVPADQPHFLRGYYRHRGRMVPIVDLMRRYSGRTTAIGDLTCIAIVEIVAGWQRQEIGILVDEVCGMVEFAADDLKPLAEELRRRMVLVDGLVWREQDRSYFVVIDLQRLLSGEEALLLRRWMRWGSRSF